MCPISPPQAGDNVMMEDIEFMDVESSGQLLERKYVALLDSMATWRSIVGGENHGSHAIEYRGMKLWIVPC
jgi:hypothetical protein